MPAAAVAGAASVGSSIVGGIFGNKAAKAQRKAAQQAAALQRETAAKNTALQTDLWNRNTGLAQGAYSQQLADLGAGYGTANEAIGAGYDQAGDLVGQGYGQAIDTLSPFASSNALMGLYDMAGVARPGEESARAYDFAATDPSYAWRFQQGQQALERSAAARGMTMSGAQAKALTDYGQGAASQEYGAQFNRLSGLANSAQQAATGVSNLQQGRGSALANLATGRGSALANLATGEATARNNLGQTNLSNLTTLNTNYGNTVQDINQTAADRVSGFNQDAAQARASGYLTTGNAISSGLGSLASIYGAMNPATATTGGMYGYGATPTSTGTIHWAGPRYPG